MTDRNNQVAQFISDDLKRTLFPLKLSKIIAQYAQEDLYEFIKKINNEKENFNSQIKVYADKSNRSLRRTFKLDPIAEWYIYYIVDKHRKKFREIKTNRVATYGYIFKNGDPVPGRESYRNFKNDYYQCLKQFKYSMKLDISNYFNAIYHHDLNHWFERLDIEQEDISAFGKFLREINSGRSIDCLPQGMYPCKMIGNSFLNYIDHNAGLRSQRYLRFMDDFIFFDNNQNVLYEDFYKIQILLGNKSLSINEAKLKLPSEIDNYLNLRDIDNVKVQLLNVREQLLQDYDDLEDDDENNTITLKEEQRDFLLDILSNNYVEEEDAELVLLLMRNNWEDVFDKVSNIAFEYPNLAKSSYKFFESVQDHNSVAEIILQRVKTGEHLTEYQLFWMAKMCEDFLIKTDIVGELIHALYEHRSATQISRAKLLEIESSHYGLPELREKVLKDGSSQWLSWCAAIGSKSEIKSHRNQLLKYFQKASTINQIVANSVLNQ
jgi:hypothetical protein